MTTKRFFIILTPLLFILTWLCLPTPTFASDCKPDGDGKCILHTSYRYGCSYTSSSGITTNACCRNSSACQDFKKELSQGATNLDPEQWASSITTNIFGQRQAWNPEGNCTNGINTALGCLPYTSNGGLTQTILTFAIGISGAIALIMMLSGTIQIMTAGGNQEQLKKGKELFTGAITGLLFIIFSVTLLKLIAGDIIKLEGF